jgi:hypothetical protein
MDYGGCLLVVCVRGRGIGDIAVAFSTCADAALACGFGFIAFDSSDSIYAYINIVECQMQRG